MAEDEPAEDTARYYIENWEAWAEANGAILIAPAFDQSNFGSKDPDMVGGGYRGLFGRKIGADAWVLGLVDAYQGQYGGGDGRFCLYGHSAGGQFVARFVVTHPGRVKGAVMRTSGRHKRMVNRCRRARPQRPRKAQKPRARRPMPRPIQVTADHKARPAPRISRRPKFTSDSSAERTIVFTLRPACPIGSAISAPV